MFMFLWSRMIKNTVFQPENFLIHQADLCDLSFRTKGLNLVPYLEVLSLNHQTARKSNPEIFDFFLIWNYRSYQKH